MAAVVVVVKHCVLTYLRGLCCKLISELLLEKSDWSQLAGKGTERSLF